MICVILAGGRGTRIAEETAVRPKPMVEIGGRPLLWHIMKLYAAHGVTDFVVCLGYRGYMIKEYFANFYLHSSDVAVDLGSGALTYLGTRTEPWRVTLIDTGEATMTGGRVRRVRDHLDGTFFLTYGDGLADIDLAAELRFHRSHGRAATMTVVHPPTARFGSAEVADGRVVAFAEKDQHAAGLINGGFFVLEPSVLDLIDDDTTVWERGPLRALAAQGQLAAWRHEGFWHPMDSLREKEHLEELWASGRAPWKVWE